MKYIFELQLNAKKLQELIDSITDKVDKDVFDDSLTRVKDGVYKGYYDYEIDEKIDELNKSISNCVLNVYVDGELSVDSLHNANIDLSGKVDKIEGKNLSTNDYDNYAKEEVEKVSSIKSDVDIIKGKIPSLASSTNLLTDKEFVNSLISTNTTNLITLIDANKNDIAKKIDKSVADYTYLIKGDYATNDDLDSKQDKLTAGTNITIDENNVISSANSDGKVKDITVNGLSVLNESTGVAEFLIDNVPTANSNNPVTSGGLYSIIGDTNNLPSPSSSIVANIENLEYYVNNRVAQIIDLSIYADGGKMDLTIPTLFSWTNNIASHFRVTNYYRIDCFAHDYGGTDISTYGLYYSIVKLSFDNENRTLLGVLLGYCYIGTDPDELYNANWESVETIDGFNASVWSDYILKLFNENLATDTSDGLLSSSDHTLITNSVQKVAGKDLSTNDYTDTEKNKLNNIEEGAQVNPTITQIITEGTEIAKIGETSIYSPISGNVKDESYVHTDNNYTTNEKNKLASIEEGALKNPTDYVKNTDSRLTDARTPLSHTHKQEDITGLSTTISDVEDRVELAETYATNAIALGLAAVNKCNDRVNNCESYIKLANTILSEVKTESTTLTALFNDIKTLLESETTTPTTEFESTVLLHTSEISNLQDTINTIEDIDNNSYNVKNTKQSEILRLPIPRKPARIDFTDLIWYYSQTGILAYKLDNLAVGTKKQTVLRNSDGDNIASWYNYNMNKGTMTYTDCDGNTFTKTVWMAKQGNSTLLERKANFAIELYNDVPVDGTNITEDDLKSYANYDDNYKDDYAFTVKFGSWIPLNEYHLKAYADDASGCIQLSAYLFSEDVIKALNSRSCRNWHSYENLDTSTSGSVDDILNYNYESDALCHPDSFPVEIYYNGEYWGLYQLSLKKSPENYKMDKHDGDSILLDGTLTYNSTPNDTTTKNGFFLTQDGEDLIDWTTFSIKSPSKIYDTTDDDQSEWDYKKLKTATSTLEHGTVELNGTTYYYRDDFKYNEDNPTELFGYENFLDLAYSDVEEGTYIREKEYYDIGDSDPKYLIKNDYIDSTNHALIDSRAENKTSVWQETALIKEAILKVATTAGEVSNIVISPTGISYDDEDLTNAEKLEKAELEATKNLEEARTVFSEVYDVEALITYFLVSLITYNHDGFAKNWIWTIYKSGYGDSVKYQAAPNFYDLNEVFGRYFTGSCIWYSPDSGLLGVSETNTSARKCLPTSLLYRLYPNEIVSTYKELRDSGLFSTDKIISYITNNINIIGRDAIKRNIEKWPLTADHRETNVNTEYWKVLFTTSATGVDEWEEGTTYNSGDKVKLLNVYCPSGGYGTKSGGIVYARDDSDKSSVNQYTDASEKTINPSYYHVTRTDVVYECIQKNTNLRPITKTYYEDGSYNWYPSIGGFYESIERIRKWLDERFEFLDKKFSYTTEAETRTLFEINKLIGSENGYVSASLSIITSEGNYISGSENRIELSIDEGSDIHVVVNDPDSILNLSYYTTGTNSKGEEVIYTLSPCIRLYTKDGESKYPSIFMNILPGKEYVYTAEDDYKYISFCTNSLASGGIIKDGVITVDYTVDQNNSITGKLNNINEEITLVNNRITSLKEGETITKTSSCITTAEQYISKKYCQIITDINKGVDVTATIKITSSMDEVPDILYKELYICGGEDTSWTNKQTLYKYADIEKDKLNTDITIVFTAPSDLSVISLADGSGNNVFNTGTIEFTIDYYNPPLGSESEDSIKSLYRHLLSRASQLGCYKLLSDWENEFVNDLYKSSSRIIPLQFIHVSDTHSDQSNSSDNIDRVVELTNSLCANRDNTDTGIANNVKFLLHTGDIYSGDYNGGTVYFDSIAKANFDIYQVCGNHDSYANSTSNIFTSIINQVTPEKNRTPKNTCYYYHDFDTEKIRLIVLYDFDNDTINPSTTLDKSRGTKAYSQAQVCWFCETLQSVPEGYGVIIANHMPHDYRGSDDNVFNTKPLLNATPYMLTSIHRVNKKDVEHDSDLFYDYIPMIIQHWINKEPCDEYNDATVTVNGITYNIYTKDSNGTGSYYDFSTRNDNSEFICYCNGHTHADGISHLKNYSHLLEMNIGCDNYHYLHYSDTINIKGTDTQDLINVYSIDRNAGLIYVLRIGNSTSAEGIERDHAVINYRS